MSSREEVFPLHAEDGPSPSRSTDGRGRVWRCALPLTWESTELFRCALTWPGNTRPAAATPTGRRQPPPAAPPRQPPPVAPTAGITTGNAAEAITHRQRRRGNHPPATPPRQSPTGNAAEAITHRQRRRGNTIGSTANDHLTARSSRASPGADRRRPAFTPRLSWCQTVASDRCGIRLLWGQAVAWTPRHADPGVACRDVRLQLAQRRAQERHEGQAGTARRASARTGEHRRPGQGSRAEGR